MRQISSHVAPADRDRAFVSSDCGWEDNWGGVEWLIVPLVTMVMKGEHTSPMPHLIPRCPPCRLSYCMIYCVWGWTEDGARPKSHKMPHNPNLVSFAPDSLNLRLFFCCEVTFNLSVFFIKVYFYERLHSKDDNQNYSLI